jgi:hypothetical protein
LDFFFEDILKVLNAYFFELNEKNFNILNA